MPSLNKVQLIGHVGKEVVIRYTKSGKAVASFSIATTEKYKDKESTEWHRIVAWDKLAEICYKYVSKGMLVYIEGKKQTRQWEDKDGATKETVEIVANNLLMLSRQEMNSEEATKYETDDDFDDDSKGDRIPF